MSSTTNVLDFSDIKPLPISKSTARWLAAVIDCEGSIGTLVNPGGGCSVRISLGMTTKNFVETVREATGLGGTIYRRIVKNKRARPQYHWYVGTLVGCKRLCKTILPYLVLKHKQAELVLSFPPRHARAYRFRKSAHQKMMRYNKRGR
jgi:hypothetical protein